jgi:hypothetical protein
MKGKQPLILFNIWNMSLNKKGEKVKYFGNSLDAAIF